MSSIYDWSTTPNSNQSVDSEAAFPEGQAPSTLNNGVRGVMARVTEFRKDTDGTLVAGGTANAITVTANSAFTTYATGRRLRFQAAATNTGATTLSVNSIGAKAVRKYRAGVTGDVTLNGGNIIADAIYEVIYDADANSSAGAWILQNPAIPLMSATGISLTQADDDVSLTLTRTGTGAAGGSFTTASSKVVIGNTGSTPFEIQVNSVTKYQAGASSSLFSGEHSFGALYSATGANAGWTHRTDGVSLVSREVATVASHIEFYNPNGNVGKITTTGSSTSYTSLSDGRRKKNLRDFDSGGFLDAFDAWLFDWTTGGTGYGVIAQDVQKVFPDAITEGENGLLHADYSKFVPILLREVKQLRQRVAALEAA